MIFTSGEYLYRLKQVKLLFRLFHPEYFCPQNTKCVFYKDITKVYLKIWLKNVIVSRPL